MHIRYSLDRAMREVRDAGFTLIELLVVIAIITVLCAVLMPALNQAKLIAKRAACSSNLHTIGTLMAMYNSDNNGHVPVCIQNIKSTYVNPWKSWRANLLSYASSSFQVFNCPAAVDTAKLAQVFHSAGEISGAVSVAGQVPDGNAGSYGIIYQWAYNYTCLTSSGTTDAGHPCWSNSFPTEPGKAWQDPLNSVYVADSGNIGAANLTAGFTYPTTGVLTTAGSSYIMPPTSQDAIDYGGTCRRFIDRHAGTTCLFVGGQVRSFATKILDEMVPQTPDCLWDVFDGSGTCPP